MKKQIKLNDSNTARLHNIVDMSLGFSSMMRLFEEGSKVKLRGMILNELPKFLDTKSKEQYMELHSNFCRWGMQTIILAEKTKGDKVVKPRRPASYGQIAKTLDVVMKVVVHYCHLPNSNKAALISKWLNAALDTKMMDFIRPAGVVGWPKSIEQIDDTLYATLQEVVADIIETKHGGSISHAEFDDVYWEGLNR